MDACLCFAALRIFCFVAKCLNLLLSGFNFNIFFLKVFDSDGSLFCSMSLLSNLEINLIVSFGGAFVCNDRLKSGNAYFEL